MVRLQGLSGLWFSDSPSDYRGLFSGSGRDYFLHDPAFPNRLTGAGYFRTIDFLKVLFQDYAHYGLSEPSDREIAISGLLERMESGWRSTCQHGVFAKYIHRLLLWRRRDESSHTSTASHDTIYRNQLPSWSWMVCSQIEFLSPELLLVPRDGDLNLNPDPQQRKSLCVRVRAIEGCKSRRNRGQVGITDVDNRKVGACWLDVDVEVHPQHCVVVAMDNSEEGRRLSDSEKIYYVLFVKHQSREDSYERIGVGTILARCVSIHARAGKLF